eukprot:SAG31_NODE_30224_length_384_cov_0.543860_1_plen_55_part_01
MRADTRDERERRERAEAEEQVEGDKLSSLDKCVSRTGHLLMCQRGLIVCLDCASL